MTAKRKAPAKTAKRTTAAAKAKPKPVAKPAKKKAAPKAAKAPKTEQSLLPTAAPQPTPVPAPQAEPPAAIPKPEKAPPKPKPVKAPPAPPALPPPIVKSVDVQAPPHRVWAALTSPDEVNRWFTERCEFEARPNGRVLYCWYTAPAVLPDYVQPSRFGNAAEARIESWEPRKGFTVRPMSLWPGTVAFRLEEIPQGTRVTVEHAGWPRKDDWYRAHTDGWADFLDYLRHYLEMPEAAYDAYVAKKEKAATA